MLLSLIATRSSLASSGKPCSRRPEQKILTSTAYHPETDGQSECTNQTTEIALRFYVSARQHDWADVIDTVQSSLLTSVHATTGKTPGELLYGINPRHAIDLSNPASPATASDDWAELRETIRKEAADSIAHAQGDDEDRIRQTLIRIFSRSRRQSIPSTPQGLSSPWRTKAKNWPTACWALRGRSSYWHQRV